MKTEYSNWMREAIAEARKGWNRTQPNPSVGAVVVQNGTIISRGYTLPAGGDHAEVQAIKQCSSQLLKGSTIVVTLEPCSHYGKTPPCVDAIINAGLSTVIIGIGDPNPLVNGRGIAMLRQAGITVVESILEDELRELYSGFFTYIKHKRPKITVKIAQSSNGCIAGAQKEQVIITSAASRERVHELRALADVIMVGGGTARIDNPALDTRLSRELSKIDPHRVLLDYSGTTPQNLKIFRDDGRSIFVAFDVKSNVTYSSHVTPIPLSGLNLEQNLRELFESLYEKKVHHILIEPGAQLAQAIIEHGLFDDLYLFTGEMEIPNGYRWNDFKDNSWKESLDFCTFEHIKSDRLEIYKNQHPSLNSIRR
ncbi:MAG: bifunctional diaminohydroxyphosphoribosylaminopyrimidine deaminase/5-amino-6-(5-phosphoribosylamino)uracil reductase RibD [Fibrobacterales bacterium]